MVQQVQAPSQNNNGAVEAERQAEAQRNAEAENNVPQRRSVKLKKRDNV